MHGIRVFSTALIQLLHDALRVSLDLFRIMVPVLIVIKIFQELQLIRYLAMPLAPVMKLVGLPAEMGLVWATAILSSNYSAVIVFLSLVKKTPITTAQATVLGTMILLAHCLPIELRIAQKSGPHLLFQAISRLGSALLLGWLLNTFYSCFNLLQQPVNILFKPDAESTAYDGTLVCWAASQARDLISIFVIIVCLLALMRILENLGIIDAMNRVLRPVLKHMGIGAKASSIAIIGLTLGIAYGGGLIIHDARSGNIDKRDVFYSLTLMGLSHGLFEDTLLMVLMGGHLSGVLWARVAFSLLVVAFLVKVSSRLPEAFCDRILWGEAK
jgi:spore maturation protein SpmB